MELFVRPDGGLGRLFGSCSRALFERLGENSRLKATTERRIGVELEVPRTLPMGRGRFDVDLILPFDAEVGPLVIPFFLGTKLEILGGFSS